MTDTMILAFNDTEVRSITEENEIWFALVDVCKILELSNPRRVAQRLDDDEKREKNGLKKPERYGSESLTAKLNLISRRKSKGN